MSSYQEEVPEFDVMFFHLNSRYEDVEKLYLSPWEGSELLVIDRVNGRTEVQEKKVQVEGLRPSKRVCGVLGLVNLSGGSYLVLAAHRLYVGIINGQVVWKLAGATLMPLQHQRALTAKQQNQSETYLSMLQKILDTPYFYFSYTYDLTHTLQRLHSMPQSFNQVSFFIFVTVVPLIFDLFCWNEAKS